MSRQLTRHSLLICLLLWVVSASAQLDTNYVKSYKERLVVSLFQFYRTQRIEIKQTSVADSLGKSLVNYNSSSKLMNGFSLDWDKISLAVSWKTPTGTDQVSREGVSRARNIGLSFNLKKMRIENALRSYRGFYDSNTANIPSFNDSTPFYQNNDLSVFSFKTKAMYFRNKNNRFSYAAAYANTQRQLKSAISFIWVGNAYYQEISSNQSIIPSIMDSAYYTRYREMKRVMTAGVSLNPGFSTNIVVFKRFFFNLTLAWGPQLEWRILDKGSQGVTKELKLSINNGESRVSFGYNGDRLLIYSWTMGDYDFLRFNDLEINRGLLSGGITIGYRFNLKPNEVTRRIKRNKYYQNL
jgi:hypothetical protein